MQQRMPVPSRCRGSAACGLPLTTRPFHECRPPDSLNHVLAGLPAEAPPRVGSQLDVIMPPPAARPRAGAKRGAPTPAESSLSTGSGGSRSRGAKRQLTGDDGAASGGSSGRAAPPRRSGRGRAAELQAEAVSGRGQLVGAALPGARPGPPASHPWP